MSYLDDLAEIFGKHAPTNDETPTPPDPNRSATEIVREQLESSSLYFTEGPAGVFRTHGTRHGVGFAQATLTVDDETGTCAIDIDTHLRVEEQNIQPTRLLFRSLNNDLIISGMRLLDDGTVHFVTDVPIDVRAGDSVEKGLRRALSTVHGTAEKITSIAAGVPVWEIAG